MWRGAAGGKRRLTCSCIPGKPPEELDEDGLPDELLLVDELLDEVLLEEELLLVLPLDDELLLVEELLLVFPLEDELLLEELLLDELLEDEDPLLHRRRALRSTFLKLVLRIIDIAPHMTTADSNRFG